MDAPTASEAEPESADSVQRTAPAPLLEELADATPRDAPAAEARLRTARLLNLDQLDATIAWRGSDRPMRALVAQDVGRDLLMAALAAHQPVLVEQAHGETPVIVGLLQTQLPRELKLSAEKIELRGDQEILLRTGRAGIKLTRDGEIELVGSRISAVSRGLFRLVGRMLRLN
jgi:hypothetical protein